VPIPGRPQTANPDLGGDGVGLASDDDWVAALDHVTGIEVPSFSFGQTPRVDLDLEMSPVGARANDTDPEEAAVCRPGKTLGFAYKF
jgi:hypothetical protein